MAESTQPQDISKNTNIDEGQLESTDSAEHSLETEASYSDELFEMYCESCNREGSHVLATSFCTTCADFLCKTCLRYHNKLLPDHQYLDGDKMPQDMFFGKCQYHKDEILKFLCVSCNKVACSTCKRNDHNTTGKPDSCVFKYLPDVVKSFEIKSEMKSLFAKSHDFSEMLSKSESKMQEHLKKINDIQKHGKRIVKKETEAMFQRYVTELQILEGKTDTKKNSDESNIRSVVAQYVQIKSEIDKLTISAEKNPISSTRQKYKLIMEVNTVRRNLESAEKLLHKYISDISALEAGVRTQVDSITERVKFFAPLMMTVHKMDIEKADEEVQRKKAHEIKEIDVHHITDDKDCHIKDCCLLSTKYLVICDENNSCLKLVDVEEDKLISVRSVKTYPEAVTKISSMKIAVAQPNEHDYNRSIIQFLTLTKTKSFYFQKGCIHTDMSCDDILYINGKLIIALSENNESKIQILDMDGIVLGTVHSVDGEEAFFGSPVCLAVDNSDLTKKCMYVADSYDGLLNEIHIDLSEYDRTDDDECSNDSENSAATVGEDVAKFGRPRKMTTDKSGYLYVIDSGTRCIHSIHPNLKNSGVKLVTDIDYDWQPESLCYCNTNDLLYVGQGHQNSIKVFKVEEATFKQHITLEKVVKWQEV